MEEQKICPILMINDQNKIECLEEKCGMWNEEKIRCGLIKR